MVTPRYQRLYQNAEVSGPHASREGFPKETAPDIAHHLISPFQLINTSEGSAAFLDFLCVNNECRRKGYAWAYQKEQSNNTRRNLILNAAA